MRKTKIEYCDMTFAPWYGCTKAGPGCANCYAATWARRFGICGWGDEQPRVESNKWDEMVEANMRLSQGESAVFHQASEQENDVER